MSYLECHSIHCPYCGSRIEISVDYSIKDQEYIEDCHICCRPMLLKIFILSEDEVSIDARQENE